jgi:hypothetical protein
MFSLLLVLWYFAVMVVAGGILVIAKEEESFSAATNPKRISSSTTNWIDDCRQNGFDPAMLACSTCNFLFSSSSLISAEELEICQSCCRSLLDVEHVTKPYEAAVLIDRGHNSELEQFITHDFQNLVKLKSGSSSDQQSPRLVRRVVQPNEQHHAMSSLFHYMRPSVVYFLEDPSAVQIQDVKQLAKIAKETYNLEGMKRDDIKDMLLTLLK